MSKSFTDKQINEIAIRANPGTSIGGLKHLAGHAVHDVPALVADLRQARELLREMVPYIRDAWAPGIATDLRRRVGTFLDK